MPNTYKVFFIQGCSFGMSIEWGGDSILNDIDIVSPSPLTNIQQQISSTTSSMNIQQPICSATSTVSVTSTTFTDIAKPSFSNINVQPNLKPIETRTASLQPLPSRGEVKSVGVVRKKLDLNQQGHTMVPEPTDSRGDASSKSVVPKPTSTMPMPKQTVSKTNNTASSSSESVSEDTLSSKVSPLHRSSSSSCGASLQLSSWDLPDGVLEKYKSNGIEKMFPWQKDCLTTGSVLSGGVYVETISHMLYIG